MKAPESFQLRIRADAWLATLLFLTVWPATSARGARIVVAQDGSGDVQTIAAGVALARANTTLDTVEVRPGWYEETVELGVDEDPYWGFLLTDKLVCPGGPWSTRVRTIEFSTGFSTWVVEGLAMASPVEEHFDRHYVTSWRNCVFEEGYTGAGPVGSNAAPNLMDCEFRGRTRLAGFSGPGAFKRLRFVGAPLDLVHEISLDFEDCWFEGPVDTMVTPSFISDYRTTFRNCTFRNADFAITPPSVPFKDHVLEVDSCVFENIRVAAIRYRNSEADPGRRPLQYWITNSRFVDCGRALDWHANSASPQWIRNTTVSGCRDTAIVTSAGVSLDVDRLELHDNDGVGLFVRAGFAFSNTPLLGTVRIDSLVVLRGGGHGLIYDEEPGAMGRMGSWLRNSELAGNSGDGAIVNGVGLLIEHNLFASNDGAGLVLQQNPGAPPPWGAFPDSIRWNTSVLNAGSGILVDAAEPPFERNPWAAHNNLVAGNDAVGLAVEGDGSQGTLFANDAWMNGRADYSGFTPTAQNLELDPRFCDVYGAEYTVQESSPCAPSGPYGQIGAFGVGCASSHMKVLDLPGDPPTHSRGHVRVAMLGHGLLDPETVDARTVRLGGAAPIEVGHDGKRQDVNRDGITDAIYAFRADEITVAPTGVAEFVATAFGGSALSGFVQIREKRARPPIQPVAAGETLPLGIRNVAPNPSRGRFTIEFTSRRGEPVEVSIIDVTGRRIRGVHLEERPGPRMVEVVGLQPGVYFTLVRAGTETVSRRVVVR